MKTHLMLLLLVLLMLRLLLVVVLLFLLSALIVDVAVCSCCYSCSPALIIDFVDVAIVSDTNVTADTLVLLHSLLILWCFRCYSCSSGFVIDFVAVATVSGTDVAVSVLVLLMLKILISANENKMLLGNEKKMRDRPRGKFGVKGKKLIGAKNYCCLLLICSEEKLWNGAEDKELRFVLRRSCGPAQRTGC